LAKIDAENIYYLYSPAMPALPSIQKLPENFHWKIIPFPKFWTQLRLPIALLQDRPDLFFEPSHILPFFCPAKSVVTLHDLAYEIFPEMYSAGDRLLQRYGAISAVKRAAALLTPSTSTKNDVVKYYGADADKIVVTPLGFDSRFSEPKTLTAAVKKYQPYFLMVGRLEKRKNTAFAIKAFATFKEKNPESKDKLLLIGKPGYGYDEVALTLELLPPALKPDVIPLGYIDNEETAAYMTGATAFLYPSLYEGFGIPLLEAMSAGTPIIAANNSSQPEVVAEAAILIDATAEESMVEAMEFVTTNDLTRSQLSKKGKERVKEFDWHKTAKQTLEVFNRVGKGKS
jgi:glycosyltransferase involved in cell wall biosynthesis